MSKARNAMTEARVSAFANAKTFAKERSPFTKELFKAVPFWVIALVTALLVGFVLSWVVSEAFDPTSTVVDWIIFGVGFFYQSGFMFAIGVARHKDSENKKKDNIIESQNEWIKGIAQRNIGQPIPVINPKKSSPVLEVVSYPDPASRPMNEKEYETKYGEGTY